MARVTFFLLILAMFFCLSIFVADGQRRGFRVRTPSRRISSRRTTTAAPPASTTTAPPAAAAEEEEEEEEEEIPRGYSVDRAKTRIIYRELLDGRNHLSKSFKDQFMQMCKRKNSQPKCDIYYNGVIASKAKIFYKFGVSLEDYAETMSAILEKCIADLDAIERRTDKSDKLHQESERFNRWRTCIYNETIHIWFMGSIGEVKLQFLLVCPGPIQRCLSVFDDKLTTVLSYIHDNYQVSLADLHARTAQIVFKCGDLSNSNRMYPFRRCIDAAAKKLDQTVRDEEPKRIRRK